MKAKKFLAIILSAAMFFGSASSIVLAEEFVEKETTNVETVAETVLSGSGTEEDPYLIDDIDDLVFFRDSVNAGETTYNAEGVYVALAADIDMASVDWNVNIGDDCNATFDGIFDGNHYTISNFKSIETEKKSDGYICTGLFGAIYGSAEIKNLNIENATINTGDYTGNNIGVVAGFVYEGTASIENINVSGEIKIDAPGAYGVGTIVGYAYGGNLAIENCSVEANADSYIKSVSGAGGIIGYGGTADVANSSVKNLSISGNGLIGGIAGLMNPGGSVGEGCLVSNVALTTNNDLWVNSAAVAVGTVSGNGITVSDVNYSNVTANGEAVTKLVGSTYTEKPSEVVPGIVAKVDDNYFTSIQDAIKYAAPAGTVELVSDVVVVDEWVMFAESLSIGDGSLITLVIDGLTIDGNGRTLTVNGIESAGNGARLFYDARKLNIKDLTINMADGVSGIGLKSGMIDNVTFNGGVYGVLPQDGDITINNCTFATNGTGIYYEDARDNLKVTDNTFNQPDEVNVILLRGNTVFTGNTINSGRTVNVVSGSPVVSGNDFNDVRLKIYNSASATIENNEINVLVFDDESEVKSTFVGNTLSEAAEEALKTAGVAQEYVWDGVTITNLDELKMFRDAVNGGDTYKGKTVTVTADIDLAGEEWTPISCPMSDTWVGFQGTFDGKGHTISNLKINRPDAWGQGLFGYIETNATIKNVTVHNAEVTGEDTSGVIAGYAYKGTFIECHVTGDVKVTGNEHVGGIVGNGYYANFSNCSVVTNEGSYVKATLRSFAAGIVGYHGEGNLKIENCTVKNLDITAYSIVGAITGIAQYGNTITGCSVENVSLTKTRVDGLASIGLACGSWTAKANGADYTTTITNNSFKNVSINGTAVSSLNQLYGSNYSGSTEQIKLVESGMTYENIDKTNFKVAVASVTDGEGNVSTYTTLVDALAAAQKGDTVTLLTDAKLTGKLTIDKAITIDGNGKSIIADENAVWYTVSGKLNIKSYKTHLLGINSDGIILKNITLDCNNNAAGINVYCAQNVVFDNVSIINATKGEAALTVNGSTLTAKTKFVALGNSIAIDISNGSGVTSNLGMKVEEGTVFDTGNKTVKFASVAINDMSGAVTSDGTPYFAAMDNAYYYTVAQMEARTTAYSNGLTLLTDVELPKNITVKGKINLNGHNITVADGYAIEISGNAEIIGEGNVDALIKLTSKTATLKTPFELEVESTVEGTKVVYNNGVYEVVEASVTVAKIGDVEYKTLQAAINAASDTDIITVLCDITEPITSLRGKIVSGVEGGVTITGTHNDWIYVAYSFTIGEDVTFTTPALFIYCGDGVINGKVTCESYYQRYAGTKLTINEPGNLTVTGEAIYLTHMDGDPNAGIYINGDNNDETIGLNAAVIYFYEGMLSAKDANIKVGTFWQTNDTYYRGTANLVLDNSKLNIYVTEHPAKATGYATVTLKNGSTINAPGGFVYSPTTKFVADVTSSIKDKGKDLFVAKVGNSQYVSLQSAIAAAQNGDEVEILASEIAFAENAASIVIDKAIIIKGKGEDATKLIFNSATSAFVIQSSNVSFEDMTIVQGAKDNSFHISVSKGAWNAPAIQYKDITIKNITFDGSDYALCLIGEDVTVDNCTFTNQDSHNIIVYSLKGNSKITNNIFEALKESNKSAILFEGGADNATDLSGFIGGGTLTINGNEANNKGVFFQFTNWKLVKEMNVAITNNVVDAFTNKAIALYDMDGAITAAGDEFSSFVVNENAFVNVPAGRPIVKEYTGTVEVDASKNYLGSAEPDWEALLVGDEVKVDSYYAEYANGVLSNLVPTAAPVAQIGDVTYNSIQAAVDAATDGAEIDIIAAIETDASIVIPAGKNVVIDLNGYTVSRTQAEKATGNDQLIKNNGTLTIKDSSAEATGKLVYNYTGETVNNVSLSTISNNCATLIVESGTIENASDATGKSAAGTYLYAIDSLTNGGLGEADVTISGGVIKSDYMAIRQFVNGAVCDNKLTVTDGEIVATNRAINVQCSESAKNTNVAVLNISGGAFKATSEAGYSVCAISYSENLAVTGGTFEGNVWFGTKAITGGTFSSDVSEYLADGYSLAVAPDGMYKVGTMPNAEVKNLGAITVSKGEGEYQFEDQYYVYDLVGTQKLTSATEAFDINIAMEFIAKDSLASAQENAFGNYTTDFFIKIDGLSNGSFVGNGCYLAGYYPSFGAWVKIPLDGFTVEDGKVYPVITTAGFDFKYTDICASVKDFICGIYLTDEVIAQNPDINVNLTLGLSENMDAALNAKFEKVDDYTYTAEDFAINVASVTDAEGNVTNYTDIQAALKALKANDTLTLLDDVTVDYYWDLRNTGGKITVPVTIDGNGHTMKFTNTVYDAGNHYSVFRFESDATVKNLTIDMSEALSGFGGRFRAISSKAGDLTVDNCKFIGNGSANNTRAIIFGESGLSDAETDVVITNSEFIGWRRGISDNEGGKDVATIKIEGNTFTDASVFVSAKTSIEFNNNKSAGGWVDLRSYSAATELSIVAQDNILEENGTTNYNKISNYAEKNVQKEFLFPVAQVGTNTFFALAEAVAAANAGDTVIVIADVADEAVKVDKSITITADAENKPVLNNVSITGSGTEVELTVSNLKFTGSSYINSGNIAALTVTGVEADVDPTKLSSRAAFIVLNTVESTTGLKLTVTDNTIRSAQSVTDFYSAAIFGWGYLGDTVISNNTFGSDICPYNFIAVKTINAVDGAKFAIENNTVYGTNKSFEFYAFDLYQNNSRANAYTVMSKDNIFNIAIEEESDYAAYAFCIEGNTAFANTTNVVVLDSGSTVNEEKLTLDDFETSAKGDYDKYYGIDVVLDADGKITAGTFAIGTSTDALSAAIAEGYEVVENGDAYTVQEVVEKELFDIPFASVTFGNNLDISFAMPISSLDDWTGHYVEIVKEYSDGRDNVVKTIAYEDFVTNGNFYVVTFNGIAAKEMTDNLYVTVYDAYGKPVSNTRVDSIRAYSDRVYLNQSVELKTIIADMLNYGAAAQCYFNDYNVENLANAGFDTTYATKDMPLVENYLNSSNDNFVGSSIVLSSNIDYRMAFKKSIGNVTKATVEFINHYDQSVSYEIEKDDIIVDGDFYIVIIDKVVVADARQLITVKLYNEETELVSVSDSIESYARRIQDGNNSFASTMMEFMKFADAADVYFDSQN